MDAKYPQILEQYVGGDGQEAHTMKYSPFEEKIFYRDNGEYNEIIIETECLSEMIEQMISFRDALEKLGINTKTKK